MIEGDDNKVEGDDNKIEGSQSTDQSTDQSLQLEEIDNVRYLKLEAIARMGGEGGKGGEDLETLQYGKDQLR